MLSQSVQGSAVVRRAFAFRPALASPHPHVVAVAFAFNDLPAVFVVHVATIGECTDNAEKCAITVSVCLDSDASMTATFGGTSPDASATG